MYFISGNVLFKNKIVKIFFGEFTMEKDEFQAKYKEIYEKLQSTRKELVELIKKGTEKEKIDNHSLINSEGKKVTLIELFADKDELLLVHNMGESCPYCHLWAHGLNGLVNHIKNRVNFFVVSPDNYAIQNKIKIERGYSFDMLSAEGSAFTKELNFYDEKNDFHLPGFSTFKKEADGSIYRSGMDYFGPFDLYNPTWHMFELLPKAVNNWQPRINYS